MPDPEFERSKIYEKLNYVEEPPGYKGKLPWAVQQQIAATNGIQYVDRIGKLGDYPKYRLPVDEVENALMLDIGCGWGRWLVGGAEKGYVPIGIDLRLEFCQAARQTLKQAGMNGYTVVADLRELPFRDEIFDLAWSFSVIQHTHKERLLSCLKDIRRLLVRGGFAKMEFPNRNGIRNRNGPAKTFAREAEDYDSWAVRYYSVKEYKDFFTQIFGNFRFTNHSFLGIGVLKEDLKYVSFKNKILCGISLTGSALAKIVPGLKNYSDSIYCMATKTAAGRNNSALEAFHAAHASDPSDNLNIVHLLQCPISGQGLILSPQRDELVTESRSIRYPVKENIPILIRSEKIII